MVFVAVFFYAAGVHVHYVILAQQLLLRGFSYSSLSVMFFLSYMPSYTACGKNLQMWITSNSATLFVVQISASF